MTDPFIMKEFENLKLLNIDTSLYKTRLSKKFIKRKPYKAADPHLVISFIPGTVLDILVKPGQTVKRGEDLMILDAMKMQNMLKCAADGKIRTIRVNKGDKVSKGSVLIELD
jgi:biotin carboxyl carrier protein